MQPQRALQKAIRRRQLRLGRRALPRVVLHALLALLLLGWLVWLDSWEWLLLCNFAIGDVFVHTEEFNDVNAKSRDISFVNTRRNNVRA